MESSFGVVDYIVFVITLMTSLSVGIYFAILDKRKQRNTPDDYFLAGRKSKLFPVALSFVVTFESSLLILAFPVEIYMYGMVFTLFAVGLAASFAFAALVIVPVFYPLKVTSVNKYLHLRYGDNLVRYLAVFNQVVYSIFYMGTVTFGTCVAAEVIMGIPYWVTVLIYTIVTTIYTSIGGIKAVIWTDVFQFVIMMAGILTVLIKSTMDAGGVDVVADLAANHLEVWELRFDPTIRYTIWNVCFGSITMMLFLCVSQSGIQRVNSTPSIRAARIMYIISGPLHAVLLVLTGLEGVTMFAYFASKGCDILEGGVVKNVNELMPFTVKQLFKNIPGINGLFIASLSSATLSTLSSCLSSLSAMTYDDVIRVKYPNIEDSRATFISKIAVLAYGLIGMVLTFVIAKLPGSIINIFNGFVACLDGPTSAIFVVSVIFKRATSKGVFIGAMCGMAISFWLIMGKTLAPIPPDPKMPPGPIDQCSQYINHTIHVGNISDIHDNIPNNVSEPFETATMYVYQNVTSPTVEHSAASTSDLSVLERLYTISYILFSLIGFTMTVVVSLLVSCCTKQSTTVDEKYLFSFSKHIMCDLFGKERQIVNSRATNQMDEMDDLLKKS